MRIVSLLPSVTEFLVLMDLGSEVVDVTHEYDPAMNAEDLSELLADNEPDLIVAREFAEDGAATLDEVRAIADRLDTQPAVVSLDPATLGEVLGCIRTIAQAVDDRRVLLGEREIDFETPGETKDAGVDVLRALADRIDAVKLDMRKLDPSDRPGVVALVSLDPPVVAGAWMPQMIEIAGGFDLLGMPGERTRETDWQELRDASPEIVLLLHPEGDLSETIAMTDEFTQELGSLGARRVIAGGMGGAIDADDLIGAAALFTQPGPRLVDGLEQLAHALHPGLSPEPVSGRMIEVDLD